MYLVKTPNFVQKIFNGITWRIESENEVFITFDDGPIPEITPWILDILKERGVKSTFFCVGDNVKKHSDIYDRIIKEGHSVGNHTYNHLSAWKVRQDEYLENVSKAATVIDSKLFRPPYGKLYPNIYKALTKKAYKIIMWEILSGDFDNNKTNEVVLSQSIKNLKAGSIIVLHDNLKTIEKVKYVLPKLLDEISNRGLIPAAIPMN
jgi:peptidoglycan/xylan/chitin deacetylase (PgdA/CDA1 family)